MITDCNASFHPLALYRRFSVRPYRVLYAGNDLALLRSLEESLPDCWIVRAPGGCVARIFIAELTHALLLFDEVLPDTTGAELARFTRGLEQRQETPILIVKQRDNFQLLACTITQFTNCDQMTA